MTENMALALTGRMAQSTGVCEERAYRYHIDTCIEWFQFLQDEVTNENHTAEEFIKRVDDFYYKGCVPINMKSSAVLDHTPFPNGATALHLVTLYYEPKRTQVMAHLLKRGANPHARDEFGRTPAHWLSWDWECEESYKLLKTHGANLWALDLYGKLPEHNAPSSRTKEIVAHVRGRRETI